MSKKGICIIPGLGKLKGKKRRFPKNLNRERRKKRNARAQEKQQTR